MAAHISYQFKNILKYKLYFCSLIIRIDDQLSSYQVT